MGVTKNLEFRQTKRHAVVPFIDGVSVQRLLKKRRYHGVWSDDAVVVARMLQGWLPPPLEYDQDEVVEVGERVQVTSGGAYWVGVQVPRVPLVLPGGNEPEIDSWSLGTFRGRKGVPVLSCECGGGVGCAAVEIEVSYGVEIVRWQRRGWKAKFDRVEYDDAIRGLLVLVGEAPRLISDEP